MNRISHKVNQVGLSILILASYFVMVSCTANLTGMKVEEDSVPETRQTDRGLTYYLAKPTYSIDVKNKRDKKKAEPVYDLNVRFEADYNQRYEVRLDSGLLTNDTFKLELSSDGRLVSLGATSEDQTGEIVKALGSLAGSIVKTIALGAFSKGNTIVGTLDTAETEKIITSPDRQTADCALCAVDPTVSVCPIKPTCTADFDSAATIVANVIKFWEETIRKRFDRGCFESKSCQSDTLIKRTFDTGYKVKNPANIGDTSVTIDLGSKSFYKGDFVEFQGDSQFYEVTADIHAPGDIYIHPALRKSLIASAAVTGYLNQEDMENESLANYESILDLKVLLGQFKAKVPNPDKQIAAKLKELKSKSRQAYFDYINGAIDNVTFMKATQEYSSAVERLLEHDDLRHSTFNKERHQELLAFIKRAIPATNSNKASKAYQDYRVELDLLEAARLKRLSAAMPDKTAVESDPGTEVGRTLDTIKTFKIAETENLWNNNSRCLKLADMWISYGDMEAAIFVDNPQDDSIPDGSDECWN